MKVVLTPRYLMDYTQIYQNFCCEKHLRLNNYTKKSYVKFPCDVLLSDFRKMFKLNIIYFTIEFPLPSFVISPFYAYNGCIYNSKNHIKRKLFLKYIPRIRRKYTMRTMAMSQFSMKTN